MEGTAPAIMPSAARTAAALVAKRRRPVANGRRERPEAAAALLYFAAMNAPLPAHPAGLPGIAVPAGLSESGLPLGLQLIGKAFDEGTVLRAGLAIEQAAGFSHKPANWWRAA